MPNRPRCATCIHYEGRGRDNFSESTCRINPPQLMSSPPFSQWPPVSGNDWCSMHSGVSDSQASRSQKDAIDLDSEGLDNPAVGRKIGDTLPLIDQIATNGIAIVIEEGTVTKAFSSDPRLLGLEVHVLDLDIDSSVIMLDEELVPGMVTTLEIEEGKYGLVEDGKTQRAE